MPASAVAGVVTGQRVQPAEQAAQPAEGLPAASRPGACHVPGDQDALSLVPETGCCDAHRSAGNPCLLEMPEEGRVTLSGRQGPVRREDPGHPVRAVPPADAVHAQIEFGQPGGLYPVVRFQLGGQRVLP